MDTITDAEKLEELLTRGVEKIYPSREELEKVLRSGKKLRLYQGFDPTGDKLHIGHMVGLRKLAQWQNLGHHVIFLIGDLTGIVGDPSGKSKSRKMLSREVVLENAKNYKEQAAKILKFNGENPAEVKYNSEWLGTMGALDFLKIAGELSVQQVMKRDLFRDRINQGQDLFMNEFLYPVMQAFDSVAMDVDLEVGGSDQTFNMLMGRKLMRQSRNKEKFVMTTQLLADATGRKIGKTEGNVIALDDKPEDLFGKIMAFPDEVIVQCFECLTTVPMREILNQNPLEDKKRLAFEIVKDLNNESAAQTALKAWENTFQKGEVPEEMTEIEMTDDEILLSVLVRNKIVDSKTATRRLIQEKAITDLETGEKITDVTFVPKKGMRFKIGKHRFVKIV